MADEATAVILGVGATRGLGAALARRFAREGLHVFAAGRTEARLAAVCDEIERSGGRATPLATDAADEASVIRLFEAAGGDGRRLEAAVYNVGNMRVGNLADMEAAFFEETWRITCFGGFLLGREAAQRMLPAGRGSILFTGATASRRARPPFAAFASAKAALRALAFGLAREVGPQGIHVGHVVIDGAIAGDQILERFPEARERLGEDGMLSIDAIADAFWMLHAQERSAWTFELDLRPYKESF